MTSMTKHKLRSWLRTQYKGADVRAKESALLCDHILRSQLFQNANVIGGYMPLQREADVTAIMEAALQQGKTLVLPVCQKPPIMTMRVVTSLRELRSGAYGIMEPPEHAPSISPCEIDLLLVPLEGVDRNGYRLGKGGGYYDHLLAQADIQTVGCAMSWQWTAFVPRDPWDKKLCAVADHTGIHWV